MKLVTFTTHDRAPRLGALIDGGAQVLDLAIAAGLRGREPAAHLHGMQAFIEAGEDALANARDLATEPPAAACLSTDAVTLLAPLPVPAGIRCFSVFEQHARQSLQAMMRVMAAQADDPEGALEELRRSGRFEVPPVFYERPLYYKGNRYSVVGHDAVVTWPAYSEVIDYELELAAVIGRRGRDIDAGEARGYVFGYSVWNDLSARDEQAREMVAPLGPARGKDFDGGNVMGPCIVTADELTDPYALDMLARVDGETWTEGRSGDMYHRFEDMIAYASVSQTLHPGEVFLSGCVGGGSGMEQDRYPERGDVIELEISGIGVLRTRIAAAEE